MELMNGLTSESIPENLMNLCRLCLARDHVEIPIFQQEETEDSQGIYYKMKFCLPTTFSKNDNLPKNICVECSCKLDVFYTFSNNAMRAEKQLNLWISESELKNSVNTRQSLKLNMRDLTNNNRSLEGVIIKQEVLDSDDEVLLEKLKHCETNGVSVTTIYNKETIVEPSPPIHMKRSKRAGTLKRIIESLKESDDDTPFVENETDPYDDDEEEYTPDNSSPTSLPDQPTTSGTDLSPESPVNQGHTSNHLVPIVELSEGSWFHNEDITSPFAAQIHSTLKKMGYKNPFVYPKLKNKRKSLKRLEAKNTTKWQCMICSDIKTNKNELMEHYESHKAETESIKGTKLLGDYFMCPVCLTDFTSLISYEKHVELNHGEKHYNCESCNRAFKNLYSLSIHNHKRHSSEKVFKCAGCDFEDSALKSLRSHIRTNHEERFKYHCEICNKGFSSFSWYQEHKNFHTGAMPFECEVCGKSFPYTRYLIAHKKSMHPEMFSNVPINHECEICQKKFAHKKSLVLHLRGHTGESAVLCDMCGKSLSSSEHLKQHLRIHTGYKPHCCTVCGKGFAKKCNLTLHERVHSGEKPHICNVCGKGFSQRSTLVIHGRYHSGERPYQCQLCHKGFVAKGLLGVHVKTCIGIPD